MASSSNRKLDSNQFFIRTMYPDEGTFTLVPTVYEAHEITQLEICQPVCRQLSYDPNKK